MAPSRVRIPPSPLAQRPPRFCAHPRRGGRAVECGGLENRYPSLGGSRVQISPPPLGSQRKRPRSRRRPSGLRVVAEVLLGDDERLIKPELLVFGVVPDLTDRAADLVGAEPEMVAREQVTRRPHREIGE